MILIGFISISDFVCLVIGVIGGVFLSLFITKYNLMSIRRQREEILTSANQQAEKIKNEARLTAIEECSRLKEQTEAQLSARKKEIEEIEQRLAQREQLINQQLESLLREKQDLRKQYEELEEEKKELNALKDRLTELEKQRRYELETLAQQPVEKLRQQLLKEIERDVANEAGAYIRRTIENARQVAEEKAREIFATVLQRYAAEYTFETTTSTITLPNEELKGRIIGRDGRNIRAFENATGVTVLIDDTPNAVVLSGFDPLQREIAREAMSRLILDGRIHPSRIEEVVKKVSEEMNQAAIQHGENAVLKLGLPPMHPEILRKLGALHYKNSYCQNLLQHSIEVGTIAGLIASELKLDIQIAKRAGLLHDIGKAVNQDVEGPHAVVGANFLKNYGESEVILNAVASHHGDVPLQNVYGAIVSAADTISASRPGARSETMNTYLKRVEELERIAASFPGVDKCYAAQAGREIRVLVKPDVVSDDEAMVLARNIARKIEDELQYVGQIKVVVVRETRCIEYAK